MSNIEKKQSAVLLLQSEVVQTKFKEILGTKSKGFITSVLSVISGNTSLRNADANSVYMAAMMAAALDLPINQSLGFAYIIPYGDKAQFQLGSKGFIQLALRSGQFKTISSSVVYEGQLKANDPLKGYEFDWSNKISDTVIGYVAYFSLINGFEKSLFMNIDEIKNHGMKFSKTYNSKSGVWQTDFNAMAEKTVLKRLLSKFAPLSIEMQKAIVADQAMINDVETMDVSYIDNDQKEEVDHEEKRLLSLIENAKDNQTLSKLYVYLQKYPSLSSAYLDAHDRLEKGGDE